MADGLHALLADLRAFLGRYTVIELLVAFALASAVLGLADAIVSGLVISPLTEGGSSFGGPGPLAFVIAGRVFDVESILASVLVVALVALGAAILIRTWGDVLWQQEGEFTDCPYCLSEIPARATVCAQCTRDLPPAP